MTDIDDLLHQHRARVIKILDAVVAIAALATIPLTVLQLRGDQNARVVAADWAIWLIFLTEYVVMLRLPPEKGGFEGTNQFDRRNWRDWRTWVSVAIIVLSFPLLDPLFQLVRLVRVVRLARLGRIAVVTARAVGQTVGRRGVLYVVALAVVAIVFGGTLMATLEPATVGGDDNVLSGIWWATVTTVGTGITGATPETVAGRVISLGLILCGVALVTALAGSIAAYFLGDMEPDLDSVHARLDEIHSAIVGDSAPRTSERQAPDDEA